jgi:CO/xanthine dehydrogenase FAD-binding subunit
VGHRAAFSPTSALVCGSLSLDEHGTICHARLAVSGQGIVATRLRCAEEFLIGQSTLSTNWRNDFERTSAQSLRHAPALQGKILTALLTGHLYQICEHMP